MMIYESCPVFVNELFRLEFVSEAHCNDLLMVYSDLDALLLFNSDNCGDDKFYYNSIERMREAIKYWHWEYSRKGFVRFSVIDIRTSAAIGTIEVFERHSEDYFNDTVLLRLDLRSDYEKTEIIKSILDLIINNIFDYFSCSSISTKAVEIAGERINALIQSGFSLSDEFLYGHDGTPYSDYYVYYRGDNIVKTCQAFS